jgi:hypothetical protein
MMMMMVVAVALVVPLLIAPLSDRRTFRDHAIKLPSSQPRRLLSVPNHATTEELAGYNIWKEGGTPSSFHLPRRKFNHFFFHISTASFALDFLFILKRPSEVEN